MPALHNRTYPPIDDSALIADGFDIAHHDLGEDAFGPCGFVTIARRAPQKLATGAIALYLHGWSDYFFHPHVAQFFNDRGFDFWAIDLRRNGRSLRDGDVATAIGDVGEYGEEIARTIEIASDDARERGLSPKKPVIYAHSTGGLTAVTWAAKNSGQASALLLNSPWLELHGGPLARRALLPELEMLARIRPLQTVVPGLPDFYARTLHADFGGQWDWHVPYKPFESFPMPACTLAAVARAQSELARGLDIREPIFMTASTRSALGLFFSRRAYTSDAILNVEQQVTNARNAGRDLTIARIPGATHDMALAFEAPRKMFFAELAAFMERRGL
ncbi:alpha/beta fold hydrolase [Dermabacter sp. p3-SID358]|uniref:alpha/beta hydrolase n=1 Tax=Dermabacter sp. p3-SID358 TaxID=2916114 RepID=UPI0021A33F32|nr:alpha/beta fold hydrolase [Dermabacter sp. p3-SID358]MCT1867622.1 alpha/beta fold hydrolase [Dermabacter sp. p3-SID358]